VAIPGWFINR